MCIVQITLKLKFFSKSNISLHSHSLHACFFNSKKKNAQTLILLRQPRPLRRAPQQPLPRRLLLALLRRPRGPRQPPRRRRFRGHRGSSSEPSGREQQQDRGCGRARRHRRDSRRRCLAPLRGRSAAEEGDERESAEAGISGEIAAGAGAGGGDSGESREERGLGVRSGGG